MQIYGRPNATILVYVEPGVSEKETDGRSVLFTLRRRLLVVGMLLS